MHHCSAFGCVTDIRCNFLATSLTSPRGTEVAPTWTFSKNHKLLFQSIYNRLTQRNILSPLKRIKWKNPVTFAWAHDSLKPWWSEADGAALLQQSLSPLNHHKSHRGGTKVKVNRHFPLQKASGESMFCNSKKNQIVTFPVLIFSNSRLNLFIWCFSLKIMDILMDFLKLLSILPNSPLLLLYWKL